MTDQEFVQALTGPAPDDCILPFLYHEELIRKLSVEPQFKAWMKKHTEAGYSMSDEWFDYNGETELERELGSRISWFTGLSTTKPIEVESEGDNWFPIQAQAFDYDGFKFWVVTCIGQGAISWIMTDLAFQQEYREVEE